MNLGEIRKLTRCEFTTEITTNRRQGCVSEVYVSTQHSSQTVSEFDSVYTSKFTARTHATLSSAKPFNACNYARNVLKMDASKS